MLFLFGLTLFFKTLRGKIRFEKFSVYILFLCFVSLADFNGETNSGIPVSRASQSCYPVELLFTYNICPEVISKSEVSTAGPDRFCYKVEPHDQGLPTRLCAEGAPKASHTTQPPQ